MAKPVDHLRGDARWAWLNAAALVVALTLIVLRMTISTQLRAPFVMNPGVELAPQTGGPGADLSLDFIGVLPALLVLIRWGLDRDYALRWHWSLMPLAALAAWGACSVTWAADQFAAAVYAAHFISAVCLLWAAVQLIDTWASLRLTASVCAGLLALLSIAAIYTLLVELPDTRQHWEQNREKILQQHNWHPDSFAARQYTNKIQSNLLQGFWTSSNTFGSIAMLLMVIVGGLIVQRLLQHRQSGKDEREQSSLSLGVLVVTFAGGILIQFFTASRGALVAILFAAVLLLALYKWTDWIRTHSARLYMTGTASVALVFTAVVSHGVYHGSLPTSSLNFRWQYWVGSARLICDHLWRGVGCDNFGLFYPQYRLPIASEDIKDPHNFLVRFFAELGLVGGFLAIAWLLRLWWEMTRPRMITKIQEPQNFTRRSLGGFWQLGLICALAACGSLIFAIDWSQDLAYGTFEMLKRLVYAAAFCIAAAGAAVRLFRPATIDQQYAPWVLYAIVAGIAAFLLHGLIDFAVLEAGPLHLFAFLCGAALAMRSPQRPRVASRSVAIVVNVLAIAGWIAGVVWFWLPVQSADADAMRSDALISKVGSNKLRDTQLLTEALSSLRQAAQRLPYNAEYAFRAARVSGMLGDTQTAERFIDQAIVANPMNGDFYRTRISIAQQRSHPDPQTIRTDYQSMLRLDPHNFRLRLQYADFLAANNISGSAEQYEQALKSDAALEPHDARHLNAGEIERIAGKLR